MLYESTREGNATLTSAEIVLRGLAQDEGLFIPETIPKLSLHDIDQWKDLTYQEKAQRILSLFLDDFPKDILNSCIHHAYNEHTFTHPDIAPLRHINDEISVLELFHGPTCAFKDIALQILPYLLTAAAQLQQDDHTYVILVATSGDTGKAALSGFQNVDKTKMMVFYPEHGVSEIQKLQMITQEGHNLKVVAVRGNFDDTQTGVKQIFSNSSLADRLAEEGYRFSSANSINWGRLVPQIVYYFSSYMDLLKRNEITLGESINFVVPTGNFGNILAGYFAQEMGLPIHKLICAANQNNVLSDFIKTGIYDRNRTFCRTYSPSMDILISSNLERLLYLMSNRDATQVKDYMKGLREQGTYEIQPVLRERIQSLFWSDFSNDAETIDRIRTTYQNQQYLMDTHTAVAMDVHHKYQKETHDKRKTIIVSTASPFKFNAAVAKAVLEQDIVDSSNEITLLAKLSQEANLEIPLGLKDLDKKAILHKDVCEVTQMQQVVETFLNL